MGGTTELFFTDMNGSSVSWTSVQLMHAHNGMCLSDRTVRGCVRLRHARAGWIPDSEGMVATLRIDEGPLIILFFSLEGQGVRPPSEPAPSVFWVRVKTIGNVHETG